MAEDSDTVELRLARAYRDEGDKLRKQAAADLEAARYERGQGEHARRTGEDHNRAATERVRWLEQHDEAKVRAIVAEADAKLKQAQDVMKDFNSTRHGAAKALVEINQRERRQAEAAA